ncbi:MAG: aspartate aminotransferase family protein [Megasphaera sp.]|jgi:4-aminobutyrate aminotransferase/(S)-3-amino-2-methylpropionate transaminase|uniref:aspartate aminotransferase family protein n=1 Tax=Megasphaera sueciensis TaxID=349094 RepID=UPI002ACB0986|nr:aspartate aminotransferase family protein [Megasphaera sp.]MCI1822633.1 aspartate aminotransferase family protein [Megasphaera sp.]
MLREELPRIITKTVPGPKAKAILNRRHKAVPDAIGTIYPTVIKRGEGAMFEDVDGNYFLDWVGGVGVLNIGYCHPQIVSVVQEQAGKYFHAMANIVTHEGYVALAEKINSIAPVRGEKKRTFFINSGAEAAENAVKVAKAFTKRPNIIVFSGAFHGRTLMTMAMTAKKKYAVGMGPFPDGVYRAKFPYLYRRPDGYTEKQAISYYLDSLKEVFMYSSPAEYIAAIVVEPLQGEGGFIPAPIEWIKALRTICDENGILLIADEVQTGWCRTGRMLATDYWKEAGCPPDIIATAKSLAGGIPLGAVVAREEIMQAVPSGVIGGTFGGNALACAAALEVLKIMEQEHLEERAVKIGKLVTNRYQKWMKNFSVVGEYRGLGAMLGIEFVHDKESKKPYPELVENIIQETAQHGLIMENCGVYNNVIRFLCPLVVTDEQLCVGLDIFEMAIKKYI